MTRFALAALLAVALPTLAAAPRPLHKVAVVVGANAAAQGRSRLQYAHRDAAQMAEVLQLTGGLAPADLTRLEDPSPEAVLRALDERLAEAAARPEETVLLFYYSGHADDAALYPAGQPLRLEELKRRLEDPRAAVRVGVLDACRGGAWTRAKGLSAEPPFDIAVPMVLGAQGSALIASSAGSESAHESDALQASFFTHHLVGGLRGAADTSQDGTVSLQEAFEHARRMTVRDTALHAPAPQHPSFDVRLHGRTELTMATLSAGGSALTLQERQGPLQVIQLSSGLVVVDLEPGTRLVRVAVAPGRYVVRRTQATPAALEVDVHGGESVAVDEAQLTLVGTEGLARKAPVRLASTQTTLPPAAGELQLAVGVEHGTVTGLQVGGSGPALAGHFAIGLTERLQLNLLTLAYRLGDAEHREWLPWGGATGLGAGFSSIEGGVFTLSVGAGLDLRQPVGRGHLVAGISTGSSGRWSALRRVPLSSWDARLAGGYAVTLFDTVSLSLGLSWRQSVTRQAVFVPWVIDALEPVLSVGSVLSLAGRPRPLVQVHLSPSFSLDGHAQVGVNLATGQVRDLYMVGFTWNWGG